MKRALFLLALSTWACGPSYGGQDVKTPDELVAEQEELAKQDEAEKKKRGGDDPSAYAEETDSEKKRKFDEKQMKLEMARATRSAESCPGVVAEMEKKDHPRGDTRASVTFQEDGTVRQVSIPSPFDGTPVGDCVIRAYKSVIVPPYTGGDQIVDWDLSLKDAPKEGGDKKKK
ncbi:MAG TPA: hypothetical protein VHE30_04115 [Polyangiaceae bacterium]|nr:hypothetical protein [Polyangiaceae bacterium]